jgi:hypothetical protein
MVYLSRSGSGSGSKANVDEDAVADPPPPSIRCCSRASQAAAACSSRLRANRNAFCAHLASGKWHTLDCAALALAHSDRRSARREGWSDVVQIDSDGGRDKLENMKNLSRYPTHVLIEFVRTKNKRQTNY